MKTKELILIGIALLGASLMANSLNSLKDQSPEVYDPKGNIENESTYTPTMGKSKENPKIKIKRVVDLIVKTEKLIKGKGKEAIFKMINDSKELEDGELYVFAIDFDGNVLAHGGDKNQVGQNQLNLKDSYSNFFVRKFIAAMENNNTSWEVYAWKNYESFEIEEKLTLLKKINDSFFIGCGVYIGK